MGDIGVTACGDCAPVDACVDVVAICLPRQRLSEHIGYARIGKIAHLLETLVSGTAAKRP